MKERPILFSAPMVRAILAGQKTQTRRVVRKQFSKDAEPAEVPATSPEGWQISGHSGLWWDDVGACIDDAIRCPYGQPGDRLWVRETWRHTASSLEEARAITEDITSGIAVDWRATYIDNCMNILGFSREDAEIADDFETWRPSIHMPRWASRILLEITAVRIERLQDISEADARAEGITDGGCLNCGNPEPCGCDSPMPDARDSFARLWHSINGEKSWIENPWVWVVEFKRVAP